MNLLGFFKQKAVLWTGRTVDKYGKPTFAGSVEIACRWEERQEKFIDAAKQEHISRAVVYVDREVFLGEYLWLGELQNVPDNDPLLIAAAYEVRGMESTPSLDARTFLRKVWL